jgi:hypothetical protein
VLVCRCLCVRCPLPAFRGVVFRVRMYGSVRCDVVRVCVCLACVRACVRACALLLSTSGCGGGLWAVDCGLYAAHVYVFCRRVGVSLRGCGWLRLCIHAQGARLLLQSSPSSYKNLRCPAPSPQAHPLTFAQGQPAVGRTHAMLSTIRVRSCDVLALRCRDV